jgi:hypothetical protein
MGIYCIRLGAADGSSGFTSLLEDVKESSDTKNDGASIKAKNLFIFAEAHFHVL